MRRQVDVPEIPSTAKLARAPHRLAAPLTYPAQSPLDLVGKRAQPAHVAAPPFEIRGRVLRAGRETSLLVMLDRAAHVSREARLQGVETREPALNVDQRAGQHETDQADRTGEGVHNG